MELILSVSTTEQFANALRTRATVLILEADLCAPVEYAAKTEEAHRANKRIYLAFPYVVRSFTADFFEKHAKTVKNAGFDGFLIRSPESLDYLKKHEIIGEFVSDAGLYAFNSSSKAVLRDFGFTRLTVPYELNYREAKETDFTGEILTAYGYLPMMVTENCLHKTLEQCDGKRRDLILYDRLNHGMRTENHCRFCYNLIFNTLPMSLLGCKKEIGELNPGFLKLYFTFESGNELFKITREFESVFLDGETLPAPENTTRGHFKRGVE